MVNRDIYIAHLRHRGSRYVIAMSLVAEIRQVMARMRLTGLISHLKFVYVPPTSQQPYATAYVAFILPYEHAQFVLDRHWLHHHLDMSQSTLLSAPTLHHLANPIRPKLQPCQPRNSWTSIVESPSSNSSVRSPLGPGNSVIDTPSSARI